MTSTAKTTAATDITQSQFVDGEAYEIDASDFTTPFTETEANIDEARETVSVSANDTHVKHLVDAIAAGAGITVTETNNGADESLTIAVNGAAITGINAGNIASGTVAHERGGLEADVSAYSGLLKISAGSTSQAVAGTDYITPSGSESLSNKTLGNTNSIDLGALDAGGASSGNALLWSGTAWAPGAAGGGGAQPIDVTVTAGEALSERDVVFVDAAAGTAKKIDIDVSTPLVGFLRGIVNQSGGISNGATGTVRILGEVSGFSGLTAWGTVYASATAGGHTQTKPSPGAGGAQVAVVPVGVATSSTKIMVMNGLNVKYLKRATLANDSTLTITHHSDTAGRERNVSAYVAGSTSSPAVSYDSANRDSDVGLKQLVAVGTAEETGASTASAFVGNNSGNERRVAQSFTLGTGGILSQIRVTFKASVGSPNQALAWEIRSGTETGTLIDSGTFTPVASSQNVINVTNGATLASGTTYYLLLRPDNFASFGTNQYYDWSNLFSGTGTQRTYSGSSWSTTAGYRTVFGVDVAAQPDSQLAQSFQVTGTTSVSSVRLWLKKVGSPTGNLTVKIQTNSAGSPSGTTVTNGTSATVAASTLATSYGWIEFAFSTNPSLTGSTTYWLVLETTDSNSASHYVQWGADGSSPGYASGEMKSYDGSVWNAESKDACFEVYEPSTSFDEVAVVGRWSGGTRDVGVRFDDGSGSNGNTQTTFKNVSGSTLDVTCVVELR